MAKVNIHEAKNNFSKIVQRALHGEEVIITKAGKPILRLVPYQTPAKKRVGGQLAGLMTIPEDFDAPLPPAILQSFYN